MKVLVCEDDLFIAKAMQIVLERSGYEVIHAEDGNKAMEFVDSQAFDAVLVDVHLPYTSGLEIIEHLRRDLNSNVPIMVISAFSDDNIQQQAKVLGADKYIVKPYDPVQMVSVLNELINKNNR